MNEPRITELFLGGGQIVLLVVALLALGAWFGVHWPTGRVALPAGLLRRSLGIAGLAGLAAPAAGLAVARFALGHPGLDFDQVDALESLFVLGAFLVWFAAPRTEVL